VPFSALFCSGVVGGRDEDVDLGRPPEFRIWGFITEGRVSLWDGNTRDEQRRSHLFISLLGSIFVVVV
jgi:hypothetical protein